MSSALNVVGKTFMKTLELLNIPEVELAPQLRAMKPKELERHARKLLQKFSADYATVLAAVTKALPGVQAGEGAGFAQIADLVAQLAGAGTEPVDIIRVRRITIILVVLIKKQFERIHYGEAVHSSRH